MVDREGKIEVNQQPLNFTYVLTEVSVVRSYIGFEAQVSETKDSDRGSLAALQSVVRWG